MPRISLESAPIETSNAKAGPPPVRVHCVQFGAFYACVRSRMHPAHPAAILTASRQLPRAAAAAGVAAAAAAAAATGTGAAAAGIAGAAAGADPAAAAEKAGSG